MRGTMDSDIAPSVFARVSVPLGKIIQADTQTSAMTLANEVKTSANITSEKWTGSVEGEVKHLQKDLHMVLGLRKL
jgi:hypothetical protein